MLRHICQPPARAALLLAVVALPLLSDCPSRAGIFRWDNKELIPGTEGIAPGPGVQLDGLDLSFAQMGVVDWTGASFRGTQLTSANLDRSILASADFTDAEVVGARLSRITEMGFTKEQLYSTASYRRGDLQRVALHYNSLPGATFRGFNLQRVGFNSADLSGVDFGLADLTGAQLFETTLINANFTGATVIGTDFGRATAGGFTKEHLYSTASYQSKNLMGVGLYENDLSGWEFSDHDLRFASFASAVLTDTDFTDAEITGASFWDTLSKGLLREQFYSTASYKRKELNAIDLRHNNLSGWDFRGFDLTKALIGFSQISNTDFTDAEITGASFESSDVTKEQIYSTANYKRHDLREVVFFNTNQAGWDFGGVDLTKASLGKQLSNADFTNAEVSGALFQPNGLAKEQLYSTASYQRRESPGIVLATSNLTGWDFGRQNLSGANFRDAVLKDVSFAGANLSSVNFMDADIAGASFAQSNLSKEQLYSSQSYGILRKLERIILSGNDLRDWDFASARLTGANFAAANLAGSSFSRATLTNAVFAEALVDGADFFGSTLTKEQLYSTASYRGGNLAQIRIGPNLAGWDLSNQDLHHTDFTDTVLTATNLSGSNLSFTSFVGTAVATANFAGTTINGADFTNATADALTKEQLYSTASYQQKNLRDVILVGINLAGADLSRQDLTRADLTRTKLAGANITDAIIDDISLSDTVASGFAAEQLYSTASYKQGNLQNVNLSDNDLGDWDFSGQDLTGALLERSELAGADLSGAIVTGTSLSASTMSPGQLYSTANYAQRDLRGIRLSNLSLNGWNLRGQDLRGAHLVNTDLENTDFSLADLRGVAGFMPHESTIQRNMIDPDSILIDLNLQAGETLVAHAGGHHGFPVAMFGEFKIDPSAKVDITDNPAVVFEAPASAVRAQLIAGRGATGLGGTWTGNGIASSTAAAANAVELDSRSIGYAENASLPLGPYNEFHGFPVLPESVLLAYTRTGDANLDGVVNDDDVTIVGATYAPGVSNPHWALGDFDYNGFVDDDDMTLLGAFYDPSAPPLAAPSSGVAAVPEPDVVALLASSLLGIVLAVLVRRESRQANS